MPGRARRRGPRRGAGATARPPAGADPRADLFDAAGRAVTAERAGRRRRPRAARPDVPVYVISVAAELTGLHPQTLRTYDRLGPGQPGPHRRRRPPLLAGATSSCSARSPSSPPPGIGLEGVRRILELEHQVDALRRRVAELEQDLAAADYALRQTCPAAAAHARTSPPSREPADRLGDRVAPRRRSSLDAASAPRRQSETPHPAQAYEEEHRMDASKFTTRSQEAINAAIEPPRLGRPRRRSRLSTCSPRCSRSPRASSTRCCRPSASQPSAVESAVRAELAPGCPPPPARRSPRRRTPARRCSPHPGRATSRPSTERRLRLHRAPAARPRRRRLARPSSCSTSAGATRRRAARRA